MIVTPAAIWLLGDRLDALSLPRLFRRDTTPKPVQELFWYRAAKAVMRRSVPAGLAVVALLLVLGAPFLGAKWGFPDDRVLPATASAHQLGDQLRDDFANNSATDITAVIPDAAGLSPAAFQSVSPRAISAASRPTSALRRGSPALRAISQ